MIYLTLLLTLFMVLSQKYQFMDMTWKRNTTWKTWNNFVRVGIFALCFLMQLRPSPWQDYLLAGAANMLAFEILINVIALHMPVLYVGKSSKFDKWWGGKKWLVLFGFLAFTIFIKIKF